MAAVVLACFVADAMVPIVVQAAAAKVTTSVGSCRSCCGCLGGY